MNWARSGNMASSSGAMCDRGNSQHEGNSACLYKMASHPFSMAVLAIFCILLLVSVVCTVGEAKKAKGKLKVVTEVNKGDSTHSSSYLP